MKSSATWHIPPLQPVTRSLAVRFTAGKPMTTPHAEFTVETSLFQHKEVKEHFINEFCFGEDFAAWLHPQLAGLTDEGFEIGESIQEDNGWGFWVSRDKDAFWVELSFIADESAEGPAKWVVSVAYDSDFHLSRIFHKPDEKAFTAVRERVFDALNSHPEIKVITSHSSTNHPHVEEEPADH